MDENLIFAPSDFKPCWNFNLIEDSYHADKTAVGSGGLRLMLDSPKAFYMGYFLGHEKEVTDEMRLGRMIHLAVLEGTKFKERYKIMPEFSGYTQKGELTTNPNCKEVKDKRERWLSDLPKDAIVTTQEEIEMITGIIDGIMEHQDAKLLFSNGRPEVTGYYRDEETGIRCKVRIDFLPNNFLMPVDLKSTKSSNKRLFGTQAARMRYDIQAFMYMEAIRQIEKINPIMLPFIAVEKKWPWECGVFPYHDGQLIQAEIDYHNALRKLKKCIDENHWPQRQEKAEYMHIPKYFIDESVEENEGATNG